MTTQKKEKKRVPELRFPGFEGEWEEKRLEDICTFYSGGTPSSTNKSYYSGNIPFIGSGNISDEYVENFITTEALNSSSAKLVEKGDLLYALYGATSGEVAISKIDGAINQAVLCIKTEENKFYLYQLLRYKKNRIVGKFIQGGQGNLSASIIKKLKLNFPSEKEQQKMATFLTSIDTRIQQLEKKRTLLEQYKKGVMQRIFKQEIRFKDDDGEEFSEWEEKRLGDMLDYEQPTKFIVKSTEYDDSFTTPVLTAGKTFILGYTDETNNIYTDFPVIIFDDFTMATQFVDFPFKVKSSAMKILKPSNSNFNIKFLFEAIQMIRYPKGDEHKRFWISEYSKIKIGVPSIEEQTKIAHFLTSLDKKIAVMEQQIVGMKEWKKGVLQRMFV